MHTPDIDDGNVTAGEPASPRRIFTVSFGNDARPADLGKSEAQPGISDADDGSVFIDLDVQDEDVCCDQGNGHDQTHQRANISDQQEAKTISSRASSRSSDDSRQSPIGSNALVPSIKRQSTASWSPKSPVNDSARDRRGTSEDHPWISTPNHSSSVRWNRWNQSDTGVPQTRHTPTDVPRPNGTTSEQLPSTPPGRKATEARSNASSRASSYDREPKGFLPFDRSVSAQKRRTSLRSPNFTASPGRRTVQRPPAGTVSCLPFPCVKQARFGLIQEEFAHYPFRLLIAVILLNKTKGVLAIRKFREFVKRYPTVDDVAHANTLDITAMLRPLGIHHTRSNTLIEFAKSWLLDPPRIDRRHRSAGYPDKNAAGDIKADEVLGDSDPRIGAFEIAHLRGCGPYALDSWRIFCRDVLRGLALDWNGTGAHKDFEPEWKRVRPTDKELRAFLRWMWLKEGWLWDPETGERTLAPGEEAKGAAGRWRWDQEEGKEVWLDQQSPDGGETIVENGVQEIPVTSPDPTPRTRAAGLCGTGNSEHEIGESEDSSSSSSHLSSSPDIVNTEVQHTPPHRNESDERDGTVVEQATAQVLSEANMSPRCSEPRVPETQSPPRPHTPLNASPGIDRSEHVDEANKAVDGVAADDEQQATQNSQSTWPSTPLGGMKRLFREMESRAARYFGRVVAETPQRGSSTAAKAERGTAGASPTADHTRSSSVESSIDGSVETDDDDNDDDGDDDDDDDDSQAECIGLAGVRYASIEL